MNVVAIIQARMGSSRLPGKVMLPLGDSTALGVVVKRVAAAKTVNKVVVATSLSSADTEIEKWCQQNEAYCFRGSEKDVLDRVYSAATTYKADLIVDITADCPLVDPRHINALVRMACGLNSCTHKTPDYDNKPPDHVSNCWERQWPDGLDIQVYTFAALHYVHQDPEAVREHVGWNITQLAAKHGFHLQQPAAPHRYRLPDWGLTLDERPDYELLRCLFANMMLQHGNILFPVEAALDYILSRPHLLAINADVKRKVPGGG